MATGTAGGSSPSQLPASSHGDSSIRLEFGLVHYDDQSPSHSPKDNDFGISARFGSEKPEPKKTPLSRLSPKEPSRRSPSTPQSVVKTPSSIRPHAPSTPQSISNLGRPQRAESARTRKDRTRVASPQKRFHFPARWSAKSEAPSNTTFSSSLRESPDLEPDPCQTKFLEALGLAPLASGIDFSNDASEIATGLPPFAPRNLQQCEENCYWYWLMYTLLGDVDELKRDLKDTEEELRQRAEQRREVEERIGNRERLVDELDSMGEKLEGLRVVVPARRDEFVALKKDMDHLQHMHEEVLAKQQEVRAAIKKSLDYQNDVSSKVREAEREVEVVHVEERLVKEQIDAANEEFDRLETQNRLMSAERDALRAEVQQMEEARKGGKKSKSGGLAKPKTPKKR